MLQTFPNNVYNKILDIEPLTYNPFQEHPFTWGFSQGMNWKHKNKLKPFA